MANGEWRMASGEWGGWRRDYFLTIRYSPLTTHQLLSGPDDLMIGPKRRAVIVGGSMSGLFAAALLRRIGWDVDVYERSNVELVGRGAGITTHPELLDALRQSGAGMTNLGVE